MPHKLLRITLSILFLCGASQPAAAQMAKAQKPTEIKIPALIATVGDHRITRRDFMNEIEIIQHAAAARAQFMAAKYRNRYGMPRLTPQRHEEIVNFLIERVIIDEIVVRDGILVSDEEVNARLEKGKQTLQTGDNYKRYLNWFDTSTGDLRESIRRNILAEKLVLLRGEDCSVSDIDIKETYDQWNAAGRMTIPESIDFWTISVSVKNGTDEAGWETAKERILDAKTRIEQGEDFSTVASEVSDDTRTAENGGLFVRVPKDKLPQKFRNVMYRLDEGEVSEATRVGYGWHIFKVKRLREPVTVPYQAAEKRLRNDLLIRCARDLVQREIDTLRRELEVAIFYRPTETLHETTSGKTTERR